MSRGQLTWMRAAKLERHAAERRVAAYERRLLPPLLLGLTFLVAVGGALAVATPHKTALVLLGLTGLAASVQALVHVIRQGRPALAPTPAKLARRRLLLLLALRKKRTVGDDLDIEALLADLGDYHGGPSSSGRYR